MKAQAQAHIPGMETYREKAARKFKENPWVPIGSMITVGALIVAMVKMRRGESRSFNHWLRVRVAAQGLTIVALVAGTYSLRPSADVISVESEGAGAGQTRTRNEVDVERRRMEKLAREKGEFEERLRDAEEAHEMAEAFRTRAGRSRDPDLKVGQPSVGDSEAPAGKPKGGGGGSWFGWLGGWGRGGSSGH